MKTLFNKVWPFGLVIFVVAMAGSSMSQMGRHTKQVKKAQAQSKFIVKILQAREER